MKTMEEHCREVLFGYCLWPEDLDKIFEIAKRDPELESMWGGGGDSLDGYPTPFAAVLLLHLKSIAIQYLEDHYPKHFALTALRGEKNPEEKS